MNESEEQSFSQYWAAKRGVAAYGVSEFEDEPSFAAARTNSASSAVNATIVSPADVYANASQAYPHFFRVAVGSGKTHIAVEYIVKLFRVLPASDINATGTVTLSTVGPGASMATQQPATTEGDSVGEIIWRVATTLSVRYRAKLALRLSELETAMQEELEGRGITIKSLHYFVEFLRANRALRCPAVSVTPDGNIYASWRSGPHRLFSIHFLPDGKVRFVIFKPNDKHPSDIIRLSGIATVDVILGTAAPHGILAWASE
jgi:hypothetical protein